MLVIPIAWLFIYLLQGTYQDVRRLYRSRIIYLTFVATLIGTIGIFFVFLLDDEINGYQQYYTAVLLLFGLQFILTLIPRFILISWIVHRVHIREAGFKTLIIGGSQRAVEIYNEIKELPKGTGHLFEGFININGVDKDLEKELLI